MKPLSVVAVPFSILFLLNRLECPQTEPSSWILPVETKQVDRCLKFCSSLKRFGDIGRPDIPENRI